MVVNLKKVVGITSSHNLTAERQFRYPVEYGAPRAHTSTFTSTGAVSTLLSKKPSNIRIESATIGVPVDLGVSDANNLRGQQWLRRQQVQLQLILLV